MCKIREETRIIVKNGGHPVVLTFDWSIIALRILKVHVGQPYGSSHSKPANSNKLEKTLSLIRLRGPLKPCRHQFESSFGFKTHHLLPRKHTMLLTFDQAINRATQNLIYATESELFCTTYKNLPSMLLCHSLVSSRLDTASIRFRCIHCTALPPLPR